MLNYYVQRLIAQGEPVKPIKLFVKKQQGVYFFYIYADIFVNVPFYLVTGETFLIIGGQHISAACKSMREKMMKEANTNDDSE